MTSRKAAFNISLMIRASRRCWILGRRIYIVWTNPLFFESVRLLLDHPEIEIIGQTASIQDLMKDISDLRPDTIIVEELNKGVPAEVLALLERRSHPSRIIGFSMNDNKLNLYHREERIVGKANDLLQIVNSDS